MKGSHRKTFFQNEVTEQKSLKNPALDKLFARKVTKKW